MSLTSAMRSCLKQGKMTYAYKTIVDVYIVYEISKNYNIASYPTLENFLFGAVSLTKHLILMRINILNMVLGLIERERFQKTMGLVEIV